MKIISMVLLLLSLIQTSYGGTVLTSEELIKKYPSIAQDSTRSENKKIMCPYLRLIERSGFFDDYDFSKEPELIVKIRELLKGTKEFGLGLFSARLVATAVSSGQTVSGSSSFGKVNLEALHTAKGVAHECGITFAKNAIEIDDFTRVSTLQRLKELSENGKLTLDNLMTVKKEICHFQGVSMSLAGKVEMGLIFKYLGGEDRGYILYSDVELFLNTYMPDYKSKSEI